MLFFVEHGTNLFLRYEGLKYYGVTSISAHNQLYGRLGRYSNDVASLLQQSRFSCSGAFLASPLAKGGLRGVDPLRNNALCSSHRKKDAVRTVRRFLPSAKNATFLRRLRASRV